MLYPTETKKLLRFNPMVVIDHQQNKVYECSLKAASILMKCTSQTLYNWQRKHKTKYTKGNRTIMFNNVIRFKQKKGFALGQPKNANRF